eukprot:gnl/TRDRNA2_/TRDRNA2_168639_c1_seq1.p1 gnl/TRDRNA2_/TRDRNA2_168639_c1~~gnl/TRDRNA2_/TRDRNA2_168639_c1_seq1.p1  ORF type:complete len:121 (+),score=16.88 gnl/TRDRNA2_/TRDRNA2_168639_c1_seq1:55-363(+)
MRSHLCRAEALEAIFDRNYFITELERLEEGFERRIRAKRRLRGLLLVFKVLWSMRNRERETDPSLLPPEEEDGKTPYDPWKGVRKTNYDIPLLSDDHDHDEH